MRTESFARNAKATDSLSVSRRKTSASLASGRASHVNLRLHVLPAPPLSARLPTSITILSTKSAKFAPKQSRSAQFANLSIQRPQSNAKLAGQTTFMIPLRKGVKPALFPAWIALRQVSAKAVQTLLIMSMQRANSVFSAIIR